MEQATILYDAASNADRAKPSKFHPDKNEVGIVVKADTGTEYYISALEGSILWNASRGAKIWIDNTKAATEQGKRGYAKFVRLIHESDAPQPQAAQKERPALNAMLNEDGGNIVEQNSEFLCNIAAYTWNRLAMQLSKSDIPPTSDDIQKLVSTILISIQGKR